MPRDITAIAAKTYQTDGLTFIINNDKTYNNGIKSLIKDPMELVKSQMTVAANTLKSLDALINGDDDDDDLFRNIESYKNTIRQKQMEKQAAEKSKLDETQSSDMDNSLNDSAKSLENGALVHDTERKRISLKLKPTLNLKQQTKEMTESFIDTEPNESQKIQTDKQTPSSEPTEQSERRSRERSASVRKKSGQRKDERKSRRSEDRSSRRSEERNRSRRSEDRRNRRSEERRPRRSEERRSRRSEERRSRRSEEKRSRRSEERRSKRRHDRSPGSPAHHRDSYYSPQYRNRSLSPLLPRGPRTPPNTPPPNTTEFDDFRGGNDDSTIRHMPPYGGNSVVPPSAHYQPGPNQFAAANLPPNVPNYLMTGYAAYMHPNRVPVPQQFNRPPPGMIPAMNANTEFYYHNAPPSHLPPNQSHPPNSYSNLIEVSQYGVPNLSNVDCMRKQPDNRRKPTIAVQKGNVLEIVPSAELQSDKNTDAIDIEKSDKMSLIDKQHQQALQRQKQERHKRKMLRLQKRVERTKRKEHLLAEIGRVGHLMMMVDGKVIKASEVLKTMKFDGSSMKTKEMEENEEEVYIEPPIHAYNPQAIVGRSILSERNNAEKISMAE